MLKKIIYIILTLTILSFFSIKVEAAPTAAILITGPTNVESETTVSIKIDLTATDLDESKGINEISMKVPYDKDLLTFLSAEKPSTFNMTASTPTEGTVLITLNYTVDVNPENIVPFTGGNILTLNFKTKKLSENKTTSITPEEVKAKIDTSEEITPILSATYTLNIAKKEEVVIVEPPKSSNNNLKSLSVVGYGLDKQFTKETTNYGVTVTSNITELSIQANAEDTKSTVAISGTKNLKTGTNTISITVTAENGDKKTYKIIVTKTPSDNNYLKTLTVEGVTLKEFFNKYTLKYTATVEPAQEEINVTAIAEDTNASVEINNVDKLQVGKNTIIVTVTAENNEEQEYIIEVTRKGEETLSIPNEAKNQIALSPVKKEAKTVPIALGTTGGIMLGVVWGMFMLQKRRHM